MIGIDSGAAAASTILSCPGMEGIDHADKTEDKKEDGDRKRHPGQAILRQR